MAFGFLDGLTSRFSQLNAWATVLVVVLCLLAWGANNAIVSIMEHVPAAIGAAADLSRSIDNLSDELEGAPSGKDFQRLESAMSEQHRAIDSLAFELNAYQSSLGTIGTIVDGVQKNGRQQLKALESIQSSFDMFPETIFGMVESRYPTRESRQRFNDVPGVSERAGPTGG